MKCFAAKGERQQRMGEATFALNIRKKQKQKNMRTARESYQIKLKCISQMVS